MLFRSAFLTLRFGALGGAMAWFLLNAAYMLLGTWLTHRAVLPGLAPLWLARDVGLPALIACAVVGGGGMLIAVSDPPSLAKLAVAATLSVLAFALACLASPLLIAELRGRRGTSFNPQKVRS